MTVHGEDSADIVHHQLFFVSGFIVNEMKPFTISLQLNHAISY
jgi:hypothetical protein